MATLSFVVAFRALNIRWPLRSEDEIEVWTHDHEHVATLSAVAFVIAFILLSLVIATVWIWLPLGLIVLAVLYVNQQDASRSAARSAEQRLAACRAETAVIQDHALREHAVTACIRR